MSQISFNTIQLTIIAVLGTCENRLEKKDIIYFVSLANKNWRGKSIEKRLHQFSKMRMVFREENIQISEKGAKKVEKYWLTPRGRKLLHKINVTELLKPINKNL